MSTYVFCDQLWGSGLDTYGPGPPTQHDIYRLVPGLVQGKSPNSPQRPGPRARLLKAIQLGWTCSRVNLLLYGGVETICTSDDHFNSAVDANNCPNLKQPASLLCRTCRLVLREPRG
jgi:hypothetical protein